MSGREITVRLPTPVGPDGDDQLFLDDMDIRVDLTGNKQFPSAIYWGGQGVSAAAARATGLALIAAAEIVDAHPHGLDHAGIWRLTGGEAPQ